MQTIRQAKQQINLERERLLTAYREVVHSIREARTLQGVLEKERQMRRLMHHLRCTRRA